MLGLQEESLKQVISYYKEENEDGSIWFNEELIPFKRFRDCYEVMNICKVFAEEESYFILENAGIWHVVSTSNPEDSWEQ